MAVIQTAAVLTPVVIWRAERIWEYIVVSKGFGKDPKGQGGEELIKEWKDFIDSY